MEQQNTHFDSPLSVLISRLCCLRLVLFYLRMRKYQKIVYNQSSILLHQHQMRIYFILLTSKDMDYNTDTIESIRIVWELVFLMFHMYFESKFDYD